MLCYINNLLIFLKIKKEYIKHVLIVLKKLEEIKLSINILKSEFYIHKVKSLRLIITPYKIKMTFKKIK